MKTLSQLQYEMNLAEEEYNRSYSAFMNCPEHERNRLNVKLNADQDTYIEKQYQYQQKLKQIKL